MDYENYRKRPKVAERQSTTDAMTDQRELGKPSRTVGPDYCRLSAFKPLTVSTYNVRTLFQQGKTRQLFMGCTDAGVDIVGVKEHRLITPHPTEELWSDHRNWLLAYASATNMRQLRRCWNTHVQVYLQVSAEGGKHH